MFGKGSHLDPIKICCVLPSPCDIFYTNTEEANVLSMTHACICIQARRDDIFGIFHFGTSIYTLIAIYAIYIMNISVHQHIMQLCKCAQCLSCRRTCTLIFLCCSLGGVWSLEQPSGSLLEFYPTWRFTLNAICKCLGHHSVRVLFFNGGTMYRIYQTDFILMPLIQSSCNQMIYIYIYRLIIYYMLQLG